MSGDYDIGKGKPPKAHQWKPNQSGNPRGSSKKARERAEKARKLQKAKPFSEMLVEELCEMFAPNVGGTQQKMLAARGMAKALVVDGLGGKPVDRRQSIKLLNSMGVFDLLSTMSEEAEFDERALTPAEERMLERVKAEHKFLKTLPDKGSGWEQELYDLEPYLTESGETDFRVVPTAKYLAMKAAQGREEGETTATANEQAAGGTQEVFLGRAGSVPTEAKRDGGGDPDFDDDGDAGGGAGFDLDNDPQLNKEGKEVGKRPNETFVDYSNVPGKAPSPAKSSPYSHQSDADHWPGWR